MHITFSFNFQKLATEWFKIGKQGNNQKSISDHSPPEYILLFKEWRNWMKHQRIMNEEVLI